MSNRICRKYFSKPVFPNSWVQVEIIKAVADLEAKHEHAPGRIQAAPLSRAELRTVTALHSLTFVLFYLVT